MNKFKNCKDNLLIFEVDKEPEIIFKEEQNEYFDDHYITNLNHEKNFCFEFTKIEDDVIDLSKVKIENNIEVKSEEDNVLKIWELDAHEAIIENEHEKNIEDCSGKQEKNDYEDINEAIFKGRESILENILFLPATDSRIGNLSHEDRNKENDIKNDSRNEAATSQQRTESKKKFGCSFCDYGTNHKGKFSRHLLTHSNTKLLKCSECDYRCHQKYDLKRHLVIHSSTKKFKCSKCNYGCNHKSSLNRHILTHSNIKLFKCPICAYKCNQKSDLNIHSLTHTNIKLFNCSECDYQCIRKQHLMRHLLIHSNTKLFKCSECKYKCNQKSDLRRHSLTHLQREL